VKLKGGEGTKVKSKLGRVNKHSSTAGKLELMLRKKNEAREKSTFNNQGNTATYKYWVLLKTSIGHGTDS